MEIYKIESLTFTYPNRENAALSDLNLKISRGEFLTVCGPSGCGKTTLLRHLKPSASPHGTLSGNISFNGAPLGELSPRDAASKIGFVMQSPENQIVTDKVWHELAFGLESLGRSTPEIRLRVAEMASFFGIQTWFHKSVTELSGGQKQLLTLASIMTLSPCVLILDEPTSQLDPIAAGEFLSIISKINRELGVTVILTEHRLEEAFPLSTRAIVLDNGKIIADGTPRDVAFQLRDRNHGMFLAMPAPIRVWHGMRQRKLENGKLETGSSLPHTDNSSEFSPDNAAVTACDSRINANNSATAAPLGSVRLIDSVPMTIRDGQNWLSQFEIDPEKLPDKEKFATCNPRFVTAATAATAMTTATAVTLDKVWFKYDKNMPDVIKGLSFIVYYGEITAILGGNGTGKTTTLSLISGLYKPYRGKINAGDQIYALPQNPQSLFVAKTVREDLLEILSERRLSKDEKNSRLSAMVKLCRLVDLLDYHPYDLSGGEQQRAALAKVLLLQPKILLLDEPTKGFDAEFKQIFAAILRKLTAAGVAVVIASHDVEFCAEYADRCALFFDGDIVTANTPDKFFSGNSFYTTSANRMAREILPDAVTVDDIIGALGGVMSTAPVVLDKDAEYEIESAELSLPREQPAQLEQPVSSEQLVSSEQPLPTKQPVSSEQPLLAKQPTPVEQPLPVVLPPPPKAVQLSSRRILLTAAFAALLLATIIFAGFNFTGFRAFISGGSDAVNIAGEGAWLYVCIMLGFAVGMGGLTLVLTYKRFNASQPVPPPNISGTRKLSRRTIAAVLLTLIVIPLTIYIGSYYFGDRKYYFISLLIILETMLPFALVFENRKPQARELVIIAVLCAIGVAGRAAFFMLPQFKPVVALVIIAGVAFGGEAGFLVGAMTGFVSNFFFGQGPWTPYQMFAFGVIGLLAGVLFRKGLLRRTVASLSVFGGLAAFLIYGGIMNPSYVMIYQSAPNSAMLLAAYLQGIPMDLVHAAATVTFMLLIANPMLEKLDRIKVKYGLVE